MSRVVDFIWYILMYLYIIVSLIPIIIKARYYVLSVGSRVG